VSGGKREVMGFGHFSLKMLTLRPSVAAPSVGSSSKRRNRATDPRWRGVFRAVACRHYG
jgi:hypothetical protein